MIKIVFEDENLIVADKPACVLVHPTAASEPDTLVQWLLEKHPEIKDLNWPDPTRAGIVHRLDKDTSGLIILAKNPKTLAQLQEEFQSRTVKKTYQALVVGQTPEAGCVEAGIVRDKENDRMKIQETTYSFTRGTVREAVTDYKTISLYHYNSIPLSLVEVYPQTGRMHQIRVHMKHAGFPLIGDQLYQTKLSNQLSKELNISRQFLHAVKLEFNSQIFTSDLAPELQNVLKNLS